jgi:hypothetical protein
LWGGPRRPHLWGGGGGPPYMILFGWHVR